MTTSSITVTFTVPATADLCWTADGVQCFYDCVISQAYTRVNQQLMRAIVDKNSIMEDFYRRQLEVIESIKVNSVQMIGV